LLAELFHCKITGSVFVEQIREPKRPHRDTHISGTRAIGGGGSFHALRPPADGRTDAWWEGGMHGRS
jgi:hypothetical protein